MIHEIMPPTTGADALEGLVYLVPLLSSVILQAQKQVRNQVAFL